MGRFELNLDCHVTALQAQSKLAISSSYKVDFCYISTCWKDNELSFQWIRTQGYIYFVRVAVVKTSVGSC